MISNLERFSIFNMLIVVHGNMAKLTEKVLQCRQIFIQVFSIDHYGYVECFDQVSFFTDLLQAVNEMASNRDVPVGISVLRLMTRNLCRNNWNVDFWYRCSVLLITFLSYMTYHLTRKPISVVKNVLHRNCSDVTHAVGGNDSNWCDWAPFGESLSRVDCEPDKSIVWLFAFQMEIMPKCCWERLTRPSSSHTP